MPHTGERALARVTYRATVGNGRPASIELRLPPEAATVADAWARFSAIFEDVDPRSLEVEIRLRPGTGTPAPIGFRPVPADRRALIRAV
jgi:hypothetical protein